MQGRAVTWFQFQKDSLAHVGAGIEGSMETSVRSDCKVRMEEAELLQ